MTSISLLRKPIGLAYQAVRMPLALVESRLPQRSKVRAGLAAGLHRIDTRMAGEPPQAERRPETARSHDVWECEDTAREAVVEAVRDRQPDVGELADPDLDVAEVQAQLQAKHAIEERAQARDGGRHGHA
jgi:hypothetical protein